MVKESVDLLELLREQADGGDLDFLREAVAVLAQAVMDAEVSEQIGAAHGDRSETRLTRRNGYRPRRWDTRVGTIELGIPKLREGSYFPSLLEPRRRLERALLSVVTQATSRASPRGASMTSCARSASDRLGEDYERSLMQRFLTLFAEREERPPDLSGVRGLRSALNEARSTLGTDKLVAVLAGDWTDISLRLRSSRVDWFDANWRRSNPNPGEHFLGDYGSVAVLEAPTNMQRYIVVVDPQTWGCVERVVGDEGEITCTIGPTDAARAEAIQAAQLDAGQDPTDSRQLRLAVEWIYQESIRFHEVDPSRILKVVDSSSGL